MRNDEDDDGGWWWQTGDFGSTETGSRPIVGSCFLYHKNQISCVNQEEEEGETRNGLQEKKKKKERRRSSRDTSFACALEGATAGARGGITC